LRWRALLSAAVAFLALSVILFTWFGSNWRALPNLLYAAPHVIARAGGEGHEKPLWYFGQLLCGGWSGAFILALACTGLLMTMRARDASAFGLLAVYALILGFIYSLIPYKTPWLALNLWLPIALFAGRAVQWLWRMPTQFPARRSLVHAGCILAAAAVAVTVAHDTHERVFLHPADETNPYAYAHTTDDVEGLAPEIEKLALRNGIQAPRIAVIAADAWPLPWYLRSFANVGFWQPGQQPGSADFYVTSTDVGDQYANALKGYRAEFFGVRPNVLILLWSPAAE